MRENDFVEFATSAEPRLRRALVAAYGPDRGTEAAQEALAYGFQHWRRVAQMANPVGYLYRVGQSRTRQRRKPVRNFAVGWSPAADAALVEPRLIVQLAALSEQQRVVVVLVHGFDWTQREVAELLGITPSSVQTHLERALERLRVGLEVHDE